MIMRRFEIDIYDSGDSFEEEINRVLSGSTYVYMIQAPYNNHDTMLIYAFYPDSQAEQKDLTLCLHESDGLTIRELKEIVKDMPEVDDRGELYGVWLDVGGGISSPVARVEVLNRRGAGFDILLCDGRE